MSHEPTCSDCGGIMEEGHVVDYAHASFIQARWQPGEPENQKSFGVDWNQFFGSALPDVAIDAYKLYPIFARRCVECGLLKLYAEKPKNAKS